MIELTNRAMLALAASVVTSGPGFASGHVCVGQGTSERCEGRGASGDMRA